MNAYIRMLLHKLTLVTGKTDDEVTELAVLFFAYAMEPEGSSPHDWANIISGIPSDAGLDVFLAALDLARDRYLDEIGG